MWGKSGTRLQRGMKNKAEAGQRKPSTENLRKDRRGAVHETGRDAEKIRRAVKNTGGMKTE